MAEPKKNTGAALDDLRVLDLADEKGVYCGKVLAGLGAEVIKIEKPRGGRHEGQWPLLSRHPAP